MTDQAARDMLPARPASRQRRSGVVLRRLACLMLVVAGVGLLVLARPGSEGSGTWSPSAETPFWSPRRAPQSVVEAVAGQQLTENLRTVLEGTEANCMVVEVPGLGLVTTFQPDQPLTGASSQKLLTANAGLGVLGPDFRYVTRVTTPTEPSGSSIDTAWLVGSGDPLLQTADFRAYLDERPFTRGTVGTPMETLADDIARRGTTSIATLAVDDSRYDAVRFLPTWKPNYKTEGQVGSLGALVVNSGFEAFRPERVPAEDPGLAAGNALVELLQARGVSVGSVTRSPAPANAYDLASVSSPPFRGIAGVILQASDNTASELVVREMAVQRGRVGSTGEGVAVMREALEANGVPMDGVTLLDGSGLSRDNKVTCNALLTTLDQGRNPGPVRLDDLLAVAGTSGTLAPRFQGTALDGKVRAKTGSLNGVTALAGYVDVYRPLPYAFVAAGTFGEGAGIALQNRIATTIGGFPSSAATALTVPPPAPPCTQPDCR